MKSASFPAIVAALNEAQVRYLVVGGLAVAAHGYIRFTADIDLVLALDPQNVRIAMKVFENLGYHPALPVPASDFTDSAKRENWANEKNMTVFQMVSDDPQAPPIDLFVNEPFDFEKEWICAEKMPLSHTGPVAPIVGYEQLIALKRAAGRKLDLIDIEKLEKIRELGSNE